MSASSDNSMAAAQSRAALGGIGDYLLQRSITQPQAMMLDIQAQQAQKQWELQNQAMKGVKLGNGQAPAAPAASPASFAGGIDLSSQPVIPVNGADSEPVASDTNKDDLSGAPTAKTSPKTDSQPSPATAQLPPVSPQATLGGSVGGTNVDTTPAKTFPAMTGEDWLSTNHLSLDKNNQLQIDSNSPFNAVGSMYRSDAANYDVKNNPLKLDAGALDDVANWQHTIQIARHMVNSPNMRWSQPHPGLPGSWPGKVNQASTPAPQAPATAAKNIGSTPGKQNAAVPGSSSSPVERNTQPPTQAGSSTQGADLPGSVEGPTNAPRFNLSPADLIQPGSSSGSSSPGYATPFQALSPDDQNGVLGQMRNNLQGSKFNYTDQELIEHYNQEAQKALPPMNPLLMGNLEMTKWGPNGPEFVNRDMVNQNGSGSPSPFMFAPDGSMQKNPAYLSPEDLAGHITDLGNLQSGQKVLNDARSVINGDANAYGQSLAKGAPGTEIGQAIQRAKAMFGDSKTYADQRKLEMQNLSGVLSTLSQVHIGRVTEREWDALATSIPKLTDDKDTWNNWLDRVQQTLNYATQAKEGLLRPYAGSQQLPDVDLNGSGVTAPGGQGNRLPTVNSPQDYARLPRGSQFTSNGQTYRKP